MIEALIAQLGLKTAWAFVARYWKPLLIGAGALGMAGYIGWLHLQIMWKDGEIAGEQAKNAKARSAIEQWIGEVDRLNGINLQNQRALAELDRALAENRRLDAEQLARAQARNQAVAHAKQEVAHVPPNEIKPVSPVLFRTLQQLQCLRRADRRDQGTAAAACGDPNRPMAP